MPNWLPFSALQGGCSSPYQEFEVKRIVFFPKLLVVTPAKASEYSRVAFPPSKRGTIWSSSRAGGEPAPTTAGVFPFSFLPLSEHLLFATLAQLSFEPIGARPGAQFAVAKLDRLVILRKNRVALKAGTPDRAVSIPGHQFACVSAQGRNNRSPFLRSIDDGRKAYFGIDVVPCRKKCLAA
jgi:hypothetical protein